MWKYCHSLSQTISVFLGICWRCCLPCHLTIHMQFLSSVNLLFLSSMTDITGICKGIQGHVQIEHTTQICLYFRGWISGWGTIFNGANGEIQSMHADLCRRDSNWSAQTRRQRIESSVIMNDLSTWVSRCNDIYLWLIQKLHHVSKVTCKIVLAAASKSRPNTRAVFWVTAGLWQGQKLAQDLKDHSRREKVVECTWINSWTVG